jgi:hypothetical protein
MGSLYLNNDALALGAPITTTTLQDSENLDFASLATSNPTLITAPAGPFNPNATGDYTFVLDAYNAGGTLIGQSDITVDVTAVPEPTTMIAGALLLLPFGAGTLRILRRK